MFIGSVVPKGYVTFPEGDAANDQPQKLSNRDVTSPINPEDYKLDSSGSRGNVAFPPLYVSRWLTTKLFWAFCSVCLSTFLISFGIYYVQVPYLVGVLLRACTL